MDQIRKKLSEREVEAEYGIPVKTLQGWRFRKKGPPYQKLAGTIVKYDRASLEAWIDKWPVGGEKPVFRSEAGQETHCGGRVTARRKLTSEEPHVR
ncbi:MAG: hypothetical protein A3G20_01720 [Acidobacteria bacterium RIFCSPLOWO2_12_FULL_59_11]|nr:MAG: hypothetical protein A3G20_01720 [Acidobacteria bacterium RIFCSPLOWO2_12_FULL_59_11]